MCRRGAEREAERDIEREREVILQLKAPYILKLVALHLRNLWFRDFAPRSPAEQSSIKVLMALTPIVEFMGIFNFWHMPSVQ